MKINPKKLLSMVRRWQDRVEANRRRISLPASNDKGYFVVYTTDNKRFVVPLEYLNNNLFRELFKMSEEEFGLPGNRPITLPCDSIFMDYAISLLQRCQPPRVCADVEKAPLLLASFMSNEYYRCPTSSSLSNQQQNHHLLLPGF
ncbi:hypothetical protein MKW94_012776 [Papaver nudicaule]|uniref:Uncharacterized protein n=1 Tax=Papaver nudicaule TaxID=74823 RepID=A0AA41RXN8_PAPNU|nr:hypothetical protein [Papaver nudicaule]